MKEPATRLVVLDDGREVRRPFWRVLELRDEASNEAWDGAVFVHSNRCVGYCDFACGGEEAKVPARQISLSPSGAADGNTSGAFPSPR